MILLPTTSTRTDTLFSYTTIVRSQAAISFAELDRESARIARGLIARGIGKGSRIGFIYGNGPDFALMLAAIARIGAIAIPISTLIRAHELVRVLRQSAIGRAHVCTPVTNAHLVCRLLLEKNKNMN